ncbi:MAG: alpha/beta hydrolase [Microcoleaceae cyanobacterium]
MVIAQTAVAAEFISFPVGEAEVKLPISSLEAYVEGRESLNSKNSLVLQTPLFSPEEADEIREILQSRYQLDPVAVQGLLSSPMIATFLFKVGQAIQTETRENGAEAIQTALKSVTAQPQGFTLLDILHEFPGSQIRVDVLESLELLVDVGTLIQQTDAVVDEIANLARIEASRSPAVDWRKHPDLRQFGSFQVTRREQTFVNSRRGGSLEADLYLPMPLNQAAQKTGSVPVIVISHGLASDRKGFQPIAQHLASHGFVVAVPQHPGSDRQRLQSLLKGEKAEFFDLQEFIDRPLDVTELLNELERLNKTEFGGQLNLQQVGVFGHSFGGYTALALAGATLNFNQLETDCKPDKPPLNPSLFLQCRALDLPQKPDSLRDQRVGAITLLNPVSSSIFGQASLSQVRIPVMMVGSSKDLLTPLVTEQVQTFTWLGTPDRYLIVKKNDHHFYDMEEPGSPTFPNVGGLISPVIQTTRGYVNALTVAFFATHVAERSGYDIYLQAAYGQAISQAPYDLFVIRTLSESELAKILDKVAKRWRN